MNYNYFTDDLLRNLPQLTPIWHDVHHQHIIRGKTLKAHRKDKLIDVCGDGMGVSVQDGEFIYSETKNTNNRWNFASKSCALPFLRGDRATELGDPCLTPLKEAEEKFKQFYSSLSAMRRSCHSKTGVNFNARVTSVYRKLKKIEYKKKYKKVAIPVSVMNLAMDFPEITKIFPVNLSYAGGSLATSNSEWGHVLLHPKGEKLNRLGITVLDESEPVNKHFQVVSLEGKSHKLKKGRISQISSSISGYCYVRQKTSCHFLDFNDLNNVKHSQIIHGQELVSLSSSPYCPSDFIIIYKAGNLEFRNVEENPALWSLFGRDYKCTFSEIDSVQCSFGSHPQSVLTLNEHYLYSFDMRMEANEKTTLFFTDYATCYLDEKLTSCKGCAVSPFQHVLSSNYHLFICDERYPKRPVLLYNHSLNGYPLYCDSTIVNDTQDSADVVVILGTQDTNELCAFSIRAQHSTVQPISLSPPLEISTPTDCSESLKLHCIPVNDSIDQRLSFPLIGINVIPHSDSGYTVFQLNSVGDIFCQDFVKDYSTAEKSHRVSIGCALTTPDKILPHLSEFVPFEKKELPEYSKHLCEESDVNLIDIFSVINDIPTFCHICSPGSNSTIISETDDSIICFSCGYSIAESKQMSHSVNNMSLLVGPTKKTTLSELFNIAEFYKFNDQYSKKVLDVWDFEETKFNCDTQYNYESESSFISSTSSLQNPFMTSTSYSESSVPSLINDNVSSELFKTTSTLNSLPDFFDSEESYQEFVPPSQDVRPMVGETLRKPKRPSMSSSFSQAGF